MKINYCKIFVIVIAIFFLTSCSSTTFVDSEVQTKETKDTNYVFDRIPPEDIYTLEQTPTNTPVTGFVIQIGAFSTLDRAKEFANYSKAKLKKDIKIEYMEGKKLYVVQITPPFANKPAAEEYRKELIRYDEYQDAWIISVTFEKK